MKFVLFLILTLLSNNTLFAERRNGDNIPTSNRVPLKKDGNWSGSGGFALKCIPKGGTEENATYEIVDYHEMKKEPLIYQLKNYKTSKSAMDSILRKLKLTVPKIFNDLVNFEENFNNKMGTDGKFDIFWRNEPDGLLPKSEQALAGNIPDNCSYIQIVSCEVPKDSKYKLYKYDSDTMNCITKTTDQLSWILIHELSWKYLENLSMIRFFNGYLHSKEFFKATEDEVTEKLRGFGISQENIGKTLSEYQQLEDEFIDNYLIKYNLNAMIASFESWISFDDFKIDPVRKNAQIMALERLLNNTGYLAEIKDGFNNYNELKLFKPRLYKKEFKDLFDLINKRIGKRKDELARMIIKDQPLPSEELIKLYCYEFFNIFEERI